MRQNAKQVSILVESREINVDFLEWILSKFSDKK